MQKIFLATIFFTLSFFPRCKLEQGERVRGVNFNKLAGKQDFSQGDDTQNCNHRQTRTGFAKIKLMNTNFTGLSCKIAHTLETENTYVMPIYYRVVAVSITIIYCFSFQFRSQIGKFLTKIGCLGDEKKANLDKGCPKSQSFYTGVNLVPVNKPGAPGTASNKTQTMSTDSTDNSRVSCSYMSVWLLFRFIDLKMS